MHRFAQRGRRVVRRRRHERDAVIQVFHIRQIFQAQGIQRGVRGVLERCFLTRCQHIERELIRRGNRFLIRLGDGFFKLSLQHLLVRHDHLFDHAGVARIFLQQAF